MHSTSARSYPNVHFLLVLVGVSMLGCQPQATTATTSAVDTSDSTPQINGDAKECLLVCLAQPRTFIRHDVEWKSGLLTDKKQSMLIGPRYYSMPIEDDQKATERTLFSWYELSDASEPAEAAEISVWQTDSDEAQQFTLGAAMYFLTTTQQLSEGRPADVPEDLSYFVAYAVSDSGDRAQSLILSGETESRTYQATGPAFICIPAEEWHHDQYFATPKPSACWLVYKIAKEPRSGSQSTLDQFGLNNLTIGSASLACIPGDRFEITPAVD